MLITEPLLYERLIGWRSVSDEKTMVKQKPKSLQKSEKCHFWKQYTKTHTKSMNFEPLGAVWGFWWLQIITITFGDFGPPRGLYTEKPVSTLHTIVHPFHVCYFQTNCQWPVMVYLLELTSVWVQNQNPGEIGAMCVEKCESLIVSKDTLCVIYIHSTVHTHSQNTG